MFSFREFTKIPNFSHKFTKNILISSLKCSTSTKGAPYLSYDRDPAPHFFSAKVQKLLKSLTRLDLDKVYRKRTVPENVVEYKFMTTEQVQKEIEEGLRKAQRMLQMPPVVAVKEPECKTLSQDPALSHYCESDMIFTDITYGLSDFERKIVIRKVDGTLETAPQEIRKRLNQIYFPHEGRKIRTPKMFEPEYLRKCLDDHKYEFILDRLTIQYEPYERDFHDISSQTYLHLNESREFQQLRSTRHFGPMAFFLAWHRITDNLLFDTIKRDYLLNGVELIELQCHLNGSSLPAETLFTQLRDLTAHAERKLTHFSPSGSPEDTVRQEIESKLGKSEEDLQVDRVCLEILKDFVKNHSQKKAQLELALQTHEESNEEKRRILEGLKSAHGVN
ncbi:28S ribosomal protein S22, mitochondrial [Lutzomyia longipalpis]|uniref:28S ribosomal protein S22, mitochondrial n=1 Tax=Lutzomyia longipalpis TaxID=7200 RepID=UPI00248341F1|nr:28S ribosomal protein S22, mitochondrial [Lutzomyia longipalpis]